MCLSNYLGTFDCQEPVAIGGAVRVDYFPFRYRSVAGTINAERYLTPTFRFFETHAITTCCSNFVP